ncbi:MAG TPA: maleylpyruvate isomerase family mycothiol-dependent enzyme, partial [Mycobacterium sp.]|nr:maleylpyruvate isomerase family mycothiol-dependent enzyme [Mycobacterium sp.]
MDFRAALLDQTRDFGELIRSADPTTPVPTCPDWTLRQLLRHVGRGNRWAAQIIADRRTEPLDPRDVRDGKPPDDPDAAIDWLNSGAQLVIDAVDRVGPDTRVWTFIGARPCGWWIRRRLHEATVHRADAGLAVGVDYDLSPELAADGISEWVELMTVQAKPQAPPLPRGQTLHLHAT